MGIEEYLLDKAEKQGIEKGIEKGLAKGKLEEALNIARAMKKDGISVQQIAKFTKLSVEEIDQISE